jgi:AcrR family transcriptional regulator
MARTKKKASRPRASGKATAASTDPRWQRTREAILRAGQELFGQHHYSVVSLDELIRVASISKQSFYNHFVDKHELVKAILETARQEFDTLATAANGSEKDPALRIATALSTYAAQALENPAHARLLAHLALEDISADSRTNLPIVADMRLGLDQGRLALFSVETGVAFIIGVGQALMNRVLLDGDRPMAMITAQHFCTLTLRAFGIAPIEAEVIAARAVDRVFRAKALDG